jgi:hypothetical protein
VQHLLCLPGLLLQLHQVLLQPLLGLVLLG